jgi:hypothetical protein
MAEEYRSVDAPPVSCWRLSSRDVRDWREPGREGLVQTPGVQVNIRFSVSLTPALSPRERENRSPRVQKFLEGREGREAAKPLDCGGKAQRRHRF